MPASDYTIDREEQLRYLGHRGQALTPELSGRLDAMAERCLRTAEPRSFYRIFPLEGMELVGTGVVLQGEDIRRHLEGAERAAVMGVTLGLGIDRELRRLEISSVTDALLFNAACTVLVEEAADRCEASVIREAGRPTGFRYSPGYGDFPLEQQPDVLRLLDAETRLGIRLTEGFLMLPRKSVTAVVPIFPEGTAVKRTRTCGSCARGGSCAYRKAGVVCGG